MIRSPITLFDVSGSPNFSNAFKFILNVSMKSSMASGVSFANSG